MPALHEFLLEEQLQADSLSLIHMPISGDEMTALLTQDALTKVAQASGQLARGLSSLGQEGEREAAFHIVGPLAAARAQLVLAYGLDISSFPEVGALQGNLPPINRLTSIGARLAMIGEALGLRVADHLHGRFPATTEPAEHYMMKAGTELHLCVVSLAHHVGYSTAEVQRRHAGYLLEQRRKTE